jgi:four helix bundle protein
MGQEAFERLHVYQLAVRLGDEVWRCVQEWQPFARNTVGVQMARSADGVGANIAEGTGRVTYKENRRFVAIARGSLSETVHWVHRANERGLLKAEQVQRLDAVLRELAPRLNAYLKSIGDTPRKAGGSG